MTQQQLPGGIPVRDISVLYLTGDLVFVFGMRFSSRCIFNKEYTHKSSLDLQVYFLKLLIMNILISALWISSSTA